MMQRSLKTRLRAEYPVKGSELLLRDSSGYELEVRNAILLYENWSTIARNEQYAMVKCTQEITQVKETISNKEQLKVKRNKGQEQEGNRKHKYLFRGSSHRSTPRLHRREGFSLSTEELYKVYRRPEYQTPPLTILYRRGISTRKNK